MLLIVFMGHKMTITMKVWGSSNDMLSPSHLGRTDPEHWPHCTGCSYSHHGQSHFAFVTISLPFTLKPSIWDFL